MISSRGFHLSALALGWLLAAATPLAGATETDLSRDGISLVVTTSSDCVDVARDFEVIVKAVAPTGTVVALPDLRSRFRGFSVAEDFAEEPLADADGNTTYVSSWRLVPKPCEKVYKLLPFVVELVRNAGSEGSSKESFYTAPVYFRNPAPREAVTGGIEVDPQKDLPPLSWKLVRWCALVLLSAFAVLYGIWRLVKLIARKVREHRMSPIERAMLEFGRLLEKGLPGRGRYKDFYIELTMVVRRYVRRQHHVVATSLTTEEFFDATRASSSFPKSTLDLLIDFLRRSDMVKFAGVEATPEMADKAVESAKAYVMMDDEIVKKKKIAQDRDKKPIGRRSKK